MDGWLVNRGVIGFVIFLCIAVTGPFGACILVCATGVGLVPQLVNVPRMYCMGAVVLPVILSSFGIA